MILKAVGIARTPELMTEKHHIGKPAHCVDNQLIESKQE